jgi:hypothetical protein
MVQPLDAIMVFHNAFRRDMKMIDDAALAAAEGKTGLAATIERFRFFNEVLVWHASGEELFIYPVLETVAPCVAEAYVMDHHGLDDAYQVLKAAVSVRDPLHTARAAAAFKFHLDLHLKKEDAHLYRLFRERVPAPQQAKAVGQMPSTIPQERFPQAIEWMFPLLTLDDRETMTRIWQMLMPPPLFGRVKMLIHDALGSDWAELTKRIPELEEG